METKSAAILLATLALGVVLGMVLQGLLMRDRTRRVAELRTPPGFVSLVESVIEPRAAQADSIRPILEEHARRYEGLVGSARTALSAVLDSMKLQLAPLLDERQRERLSRMATLPDPNRPPPRRDDRPREEAPPQPNPPREGAAPQGNPPREGGPPPADQPRGPGGSPRDRRPGANPPSPDGPPRDQPPPKPPR